MAPSPSSRQHRSPPEEVSLVESIRWIRGLVPLAAVALMGGAAGARPPALGAADVPWEPPPCSEAASSGEAATDTHGASAWYRLDGRLDADGTLTGHDLVVAAGDEVERSLRLPPEAFASGPRTGTVLVGEDDG